MRGLVLTALLLAMAASPLASAQQKEVPARQSAQAQIDYDGFQHLTREVNAYREGRLVSLADFQRMAREPNTIILDARSVAAFNEGHIDGAINLPFTDFTAPSLAAALRDPNTRILIYCNNNFSNNQQPVILKRVELALNIQTFINLYGYGYRNIYELGEVVDFNDPAVRWVRA
ncbi:MAG: rhodanese-like domain-containing protein [Hyphomonadaceae bacterium]|nr:rhodanese-like domain-containing protein [Hyphomonadaceae bacterium]